MAEKTLAATYVLFADQLNPDSSTQEISKLSQKIAHPTVHKGVKASIEKKYQPIDYEDLSVFVRDEVSAANREWFGNLARGFNEYMQGDVHWNGDYNEDGEFEDGSRIVVRDDKGSRKSSSTGKNSLYDQKKEWILNRVQDGKEGQNSASYDKNSLYEKTSLRPNQAYDHYKNPARTDTSNNNSWLSMKATPRPDPAVAKGYGQHGASTTLSSNHKPSSSSARPELVEGSRADNQKYNRFTKRPRTYYRPTELNLLEQDMPPLDERFLEGQGGEGATFPHFVFGDKTHAFVAGETGLWQAQVQAKEAAATEEIKSRAATTRSAGATNQVVLTQPEKITLNGTPNQESPLTASISHLTLYGEKMRPAVVVADAADATEPEMSLKIFAAVDDAANSFINNDTSQANSMLYDATQKLNAGNTLPDSKAINQAIVAMTASRAKPSSGADGRFFIAVADGGEPSGKLYKRPENWDTETVQTAITDGMKALKDNTNAVIVGGANNDLINALATVTPADPSPDAKTTAYVNAVTRCIGDTIFLSGLDKKIGGLNQKYADLAFRNAINLRKGGLIDLAKTAEGSVAANDVLALMPDATKIKDQINAAKSPVDFQITADNKQNVVAAAIQVGLGWGINQLAAATKDEAILDKTKPFASLDSHNAPGDGKDAAPSDLNVYVIDQDGGSRGVCVADLTGNKITTKNGADFIIKPGKIITRAMYEGIDLTKAAALAAGFGKLEQIGIPCAVYSAADAYPATQAIINGNIDMVYDDQLQRLFVGFEDISLGDNAGSLTNGSGAVCSVMVGQEKTIPNPGGKPSLYFQPVIANFQPLLFQQNLNPNRAGTPIKVDQNNFIAGFYQKQNQDKLDNASPADDLHASAKKLRVMHTSTGKDYLLFNGGVTTKANLSTLGSKVYALPLVSAYDAALNDVAEAGQLAARTATIVAGEIVKEQNLLEAINFAKPTGYWGNLADEHLNKLLADRITKVNEEVDHVIANYGQANAVAAATAIKNKNDLVAGLGRVALEAAYPKSTTDGEFAQKASTLIIGDYSALPLKESGIFKATEEAILQADNDPTKQAPADQLWQYLKKDFIETAIGTNTAANAYNKVHKNHPVINAGLVAGDIADVANKALGGALQSIEGALGLAINETKDNAVRHHKLLKAVNTMHTDAAFPAFDYVRVGCDAKRLSYDTSARVQDVQVVGDTVYVSLGGNRDAGHTDEAGVFASTAIFNEAGFVRSWSPWRRVLGQNNPVGSVALDAQTSLYWYTANKDNGPLTDEANKLDSVRVTSWGRGFNPSDSSDTRLSTALDDVFGDIGGIFGLYSFGPDTPGFKPRDPSHATPANRHEQFSMTVATGNGRVALIKTGAFDKKDGIFVPTAHAAGGYIKHDGPTPGANIFVFDAAISAANNDNAGTALANLGLITCAEVSRLPLADSPNDSRGWLFVGGSGGLAVLTRWNTGRGWNTGTGQGLADLLPGTQRDDFPAGAGWRFMQILVNDATGKPINPFSDVRKLVSDGSRYLYVMTAKAIWRIDMAAVPLGNGPGLGGANPGRTMQKYGIFQRKEFVPPTAAPANNEYTVVLEGENLAHKVADMDAQTTPPGAPIFADKEAGQFLDMMVGYHKATSPVQGAGGVAVVDPANAKTQLIIGTTNGLFYNAQAAQFKDTKPAAAPQWTQLKSAAGTAHPVNDPIAGPVMRLEFTSSQVGDQLKKPIDQKTPADQTQYYADGNLQVTAFSADKKELAVYRFNLSAADWQNPDQVAITAFVEPYKISGDDTKTTPYFYKVGTLNPGDEKKIEFGGPLDYFTRTAHVTGSTEGFADGVWMTPQLSDFERDQTTGHFEDIDLGYDLTLPLYLGNIQIEPASGAQMVTGEFGLRVND